MANPPTEGPGSPNSARLKGFGVTGVPRHAGHDGHRRYTRIVRLLRWFLPSCALFLAVLLLTWPFVHLIELSDVIPVTGLERPTSERSTMTNVRFLGTDRDGLPFTFNAGTAWHDSGRGEMVFLEDVSGNIVVGDGEWTSVRADSGFYDQTGQVLTLESGVTVFTSDGYQLESERALIDLEKGTANSDTLVRGTGLSGTLEARGFQVTDNGGKFKFFGRVELSLVPDIRS